jgi:prefoldin subunit 5
MSSIEEDLGYIKGQIESLQEQLRELDDEQKLLLQEVQALDKQLTLYRHIIMFIRTALWIGVAIMTFKFGDIPSIWKGDK